MASRWIQTYGLRLTFRRFTFVAVPQEPSEFHIASRRCSYTRLRRCSSNTFLSSCRRPFLFWIVVPASWASGLPTGEHASTTPSASPLPLLPPSTTRPMRSRI